MTYDSDVEDARETTPILGRYPPDNPDTLKPKRTTFSYFIHFFGGGIYMPDASTYSPIEVILNTKDPEERDRLTAQWRDNRLSELSFVGVVSALLAGVLTSTGSWPNILPDGQESPWPVRTSWYCGIVLSLFSILTAADQTVRLHRLSSHRDGFRNIRNLLARTNSKQKRSKRTGRLQPSTAQVYAWQMPVMFLTTATISMIIGMFLHIWSATRQLTHDQWWNPDTKVAITFTIVAIVSIGLFFIGQVSLYAPDTDPEIE